jgi:O-antigen ligase
MPAALKDQMGGDSGESADRGTGIEPETSGPASLFRFFRQLPTLDQMNLVFTGILLGWAGVVGSGVSILFSGAILWAFLRLYQRRIVFPADRGILAIAAAFAFYVAADTISALFNDDGWITWREVVEDLPFLGFPFVYARLSLSRREDVIEAVERGAIGGAFIMLAVVAVELIFTPHIRAEGMAGNPGVLAVVASLVYGICLLAATRHRGRTKWLALAAALCAVVTILFTGMRALWPFLLIAPAVQIIILRPAFNWPSVRRGALVAALPLLGVFYLTHGMIEQRLEAAVVDVEKAETGDYDSSIGKRLEIWRNGLDKAVQNPLLGAGPGSARKKDSPSMGFSHYHNFLLNSMIRSGVIGVLAILGLFAIPLWVLVRRVRDDVGLAGLSLLLSVQIAFLLSGSVGIMLGHDIHDSLFIYSTIVASFLIAGRQTLPSAGAAGDPA